MFFDVSIKQCYVCICHHAWTHAFSIPCHPLTPGNKLSNCADWLNEYVCLSYYSNLIPLLTRSIDIKGRRYQRGKGGVVHRALYISLSQIPHALS